MAEFIYVAFSFLALFTLSSAINLPNNPCPEYFSYEIWPDDVTGLVTIPFQGLPIHLEVEASMRGLYSKRQSIMTIELLNDTNDLLFAKDVSVRYRIHFPIKKSIPKISRITVNGASICDGPKLLLSGLICTVTKLKYTHIYPTNSTKRQKRQEPDQPGILEVIPEGNEYFYPLRCVDYVNLNPVNPEPTRQEGKEEEEEEEEEYEDEYEDDERPVNVTTESPKPNRRKSEISNEKRITIATTKTALKIPRRAFGSRRAIIKKDEEKEM